MRLSARDLGRLEEAVPGLYELRGRERFPREVLPVLAGIVPCDSCSYNEVDLVQRRIEWTTWPGKVEFPDHDLILNQHIHEHPLLDQYVMRGPGRTDMLGSARKISDVVSPSAFRMTGIYNEYYRRIDLEHQMSLAIAAFDDDALRGSGFAFNRGGRDFDERDRLVLNLLRPHLALALANADVISRIESELALLRRGLDALHAGLAFLDDDGHVDHMSAGMRRLLVQRYGERSLANGRLPEDVERWARAQKNAPADSRLRAPFALSGGGGRYLLRLVSDRAGHLMVVDEPPQAITPEALEGLGLTTREAEVLTWICKGKTNAEIAVILEISKRTVDKHAERIFPKLGVETRSAATVFVQQCLAATQKRAME